MSDSVRPRRREPTRLRHPWDSPGTNTGVGCHYLLHAWKWKVKVKSLSRVRLLATPWTAAYQSPPSMGFSREEYWSGLPLPSPGQRTVHHNSVLKTGCCWVALLHGASCSTLPYHGWHFPNLYRRIHRNKMASLWVIVFNLRTRTILHFFLKKILHFTFKTSREVLGRKNIFDLISTVLRANFVFICGCPEGIIQNRELGHQGWAEWRIWLFCLSYLGE